MKKAIIIIIVVLVVLAGVFSGLYFFTDTFNFLKPASDNFSMQAKKLMGIEEDPKYSEYEEFLNKLKTDSSTSTELNVSMNLSLPSNVIDYSTQRLINSSSIKYKGSYNADSKAMLNDVELYKDNDKVISLSTIAKDQALSVGSTDLYDKYLTFDMSKYESFCQANNIEVDEETKQSLETLSKLKNIDTNQYIYDLYYISEEDFNSLHTNYENILVDLVDAENYETKKNQKITVDGEDVKTTAYSLTMTGEDAIDFTNKLIELMKNDSTLKKLIIDKYNLIKEYSSTSDEILNETTSTEFPELTESDLDSLFDDLIEELEDAKSDFKDTNQCIKLTIYSNKKSEPVKFELAILDDKDDDEGSVIFTEELTEGKNTYKIDLEEIAKLSDDESSSSSSITNSNSALSSSNTTNSINSSSLSSATSTLDSIADSLTEIIIEDSYEKTEDSRKGTITVSAKASGSKQDIIEIAYDIVNSASESKFNISVTSPIYSALSFDLVCEVNGLDTDTQNVKFNVSGKYSAYSVEFSADGTVKDGAEVPELNEANSVDVFASSAEEIQTVYTDIITKAADVLPSKLSAYGINITKEEILSNLPQATTNTSATPNEGTTDSNAENTTEQPAA